MIPFLPYPKIREVVLDWPEATENGVRSLLQGPWVATEKIHGANLCLCTDGNEFAAAKRRQLLSPQDTFFDYRNALGLILGPARQVFEWLDDIEWIFIYGELFGGVYPHPEVTLCPGVKPVQTGVYYSAEVRFMAFDLEVLKKSGEREFLAFDEAREIFENAGMPVVPILARGNFSEVNQCPVAFETRVPAELGLPTIKENYAEGFVLRPANLSCSREDLAHRPVVKRKHTKFAESVYHASEPWGIEPPADPLNEAEKSLQSLLTENRLSNAISKVGPAEEKQNQQVIMKEFISDARREWEQQWGALLFALAAEERELLWSFLNDEAKDLLTHYLSGKTEIDPERYYADLAWAFLRGRLPNAGTGIALIKAARAEGLRWHRFKRKDGPARILPVLSALTAFQPRTLLDIGPGRGAFLWPLLGQFTELEVSTVDCLPHRVEDIEAVRTGGIDRVNARLGDVTELDFETDSFDIATILEVLEHLEDPAAAARELLRVAKNYVIASVPSHEDDNPEHIRLFTEQSLTDLFVDSGAGRVEISHVRNHMIAIIHTAMPRE